MRRKFLRELAAAGLPRGPERPPAVVSEADVEPLPEAAQRYLSFMRVVGRPRDWSFRLALRGRFRPAPGEGCRPCEAWQYDSAPAVARIFHIRLRLAGIVPVLARDTYLKGRGRMLVRLLDLVTVADGSGEEFDVGELVTYLNDAVLIAPSMLLTPGARWTHVDSHAFDVALTDRGRTVTARVETDRHGAPTIFSTTDRFYADPKAPRPVRARWTTPIENWKEVDGRQVFTRARAVWDLLTGSFEYADFTPVPGSLEFNVAP